MAARDVALPVKRRSGGGKNSFPLGAHEASGRTGAPPRLGVGCVYQASQIGLPSGPRTADQEVRMLAWASSGSGV